MERWKESETWTFSNTHCHHPAAGRRALAGRARTPFLGQYPADIVRLCPRDHSCDLGDREKIARTQAVTAEGNRLTVTLMCSLAKVSEYLAALL